MPRDDRKLAMEELGRVPAHDYAPKNALVVVLDDVRSRHNVGSIFRTADSFGIRSIELCGFTPCPPHREIEKTALGATDSVPWRHHDDVAECLKGLKENGFTLIAVEQTLRAMPLQEVRATAGPIALIFGNELNGVSDAVIKICDLAVVIPQYGSKHSLNVSVCAGIVLWWLAGR